MLSGFNAGATFGSDRPSGTASDSSSPVDSLKIGDALPEFVLQDFRGKSHHSNELDNRPVIVFFFGVECPIVQYYASQMDQLAAGFDDEPIQWIGINSNQHDSLKEIEHFGNKHQLNFPLLKDPGNRIADAFGATRTPEVFLFDANHKLQYRGAIDDRYSYGQQKPVADKTFLVDALTAIKNRQPPLVTQTKAVGCIIGRLMEADQTSQVTYSNQISRIIQRRCLECHRDGEVAPFSMTDYQEVVGWAEMILEVVEDRRMPPWHASPDYGHFRNDARLTDQELSDIRTWVAAGAPQGDPADLPEPVNFVEGWRIGKPDVIIPMAERPFPVKANGIMPYKHFVVDPGFTEDKWIQAAECRIGNRAVVHHIIVAIHDERNRPQVHGQVESEFLAATAPGARPLILPEGHAKLIPAGSKLIFQMHYTPNGTAQTDLSQVGFKFADPATVKKSVGTRQAINSSFKIPPRETKEVIAWTDKFPADVMILSLFPHMHLRGKSFRYIAHYPGGEEEILLDVPQFDFNWQNGYEFVEPKRLPKGSRLQCIAHYDNTEKNFANPNPDLLVKWGEQTTDEMMIGYFDMVYADQDLTIATNLNRTQSLLEHLSNDQDLVDSQLVESAKSSLRSAAEMEQFGRQLQQAFPQIDRVCWTTINGNTLTVRRVAQVDSFAASLKGEGVSTKAKPCRLFAISQQDQPVALNNLTKLKAPDISHMSAVANSSFHIPLKIAGAAGTINFWSSENEAFPKPVQELLVQLVNESLPD